VHARRGAISAAGVAATQILPHPAIGVEVAGELALAPGAFATLGLAFFPEQGVLQSDANVHFGLTWGTLGLCWRPLSAGPIEFGGCASALAGGLHIVVASPQPDQVGERFYAGASLGPQSVWSLAPGLELRLRADLVAPFARRTFVVARDAENSMLFRQPVVAGTLALGLAARF
jgi:hypothetical protein